VTLVVGVGNPDLGDDGVGAAVVAALPSTVRTAVVGEPVDLLDAWSGESHVVLVDAMADPSSPPGTVVVTGPDDPRVRRDAPVGTHAMAVPTALDLAAALGSRPERVVVVGVVGESFRAGAGLSRAVSRAVPDVAGVVLDQLADRA
jgi:hydrogenase maturation protease